MRGRTIWTKPKPLTAVRSNGCGRIASIAAAAAWRAGLAAGGRQVDPDRAADVEPADRLAPLRPRRRTASSPAIEKAVDVDQGHRRRRRNAQLAAGEADDAAARLVDQIVPARAAKLVRRGQRIRAFERLRVAAALRP